MQVSEYFWNKSLMFSVGKVTFIDQEYGMYNYQPFDIGNHFCEYAGKYSDILLSDMKGVWEIHFFTTHMISFFPNICINTITESAHCIVYFMKELCK